MVAIILDSMVDEDRNLVIQLSENVPPGRVEVTIRSLETESKTPLTREESRVRLAGTTKRASIRL